MSDIGQYIPFLSKRKKKKKKKDPKSEEIKTFQPDKETNSSR
jgi:hypothetical protein